MAWLRRLLNVCRPSRVAREIEREMFFHMAEREDQLRDSGMNREEATRQARRQFGNPTVQFERTRDVDVAVWLDTLWRNVRYGVRTLTRAPGFAVTAVLTLALAIGANSAVFSALDAILLQPLAYPHGERLMWLGQTQDIAEETNIAPVRLEDWHRLNVTFEAISGYLTEDVSDTSGDLPERVRRARVAPRFLDVLGIAPALGRDFVASEHVDGGPAAVLISDRYWRQRLGGDPSVLGQQVRIEETVSSIVGIMPASFQFPDRDVDLWFPAAVDHASAQSRQATWYVGVGRLKANITADEARANMAVVQTQLRAQHPDTDAEIGVTVVPLKDTTVGAVRGSLWLLYGAVSVLLLITCINIAALLLSRAARRQQEVSVRLALGASRGALVAQMLAETAVLVCAGAVVGVFVAAGALAGFRGLVPNLPRLDEVTIDASIALYTAACAIAVAVFCGLFPALRSAGAVIAQPDASRVQTSSRHAVQWTLVGAQIALSVTLLSGAGLLVRSFQQLSSVAPGFDTSAVLTFRVSGSYAETADYGRLVQRINGTLDALRAIPGIDAAATAGMLPGVPDQYEREFEVVEGRAETEPRLVAESRTVSPSYFATMQIPLVDGQPCRGRPLNTTQDVLVNRLFAERYFSTLSPIGLQLAETGRIVGIVGDARERGINNEPVPTVYSCFSAPTPMPVFLVRTPDQPMAVAPSVRRTLKELEPLRSVYDIAPLEQRIGDAFAQDRLRMVVLVLFATAALAMACVGVYGTLAYVISLRRREVGLRMALGALRRDVVRHFLLRALRVVVLACAVGIGISAALGRFLSGMLYGVSPSDPVTLSGVVAMVCVVAALAAVIPIARVAFVDPIGVLREE